MSAVANASVITHSSCPVIPFLGIPHLLPSCEILRSELLHSRHHPKIASKRLGHSKIGIAFDLYSHVLPGMEADATERVDAALQAAINRRSKAIGQRAVANEGF
jgi:hypothetical protein